MDDNLTLNKAHIIDLCNEILRRKIKIIFNTPNGVWINSIREEVVAKMAEAGFVHAGMPIEHGDEYIRNKVIGKVLDRKKIFEASARYDQDRFQAEQDLELGFLRAENGRLQEDT